MCDDVGNDPRSALDIDLTNHYPADVATVFAMIGDEGFLRERYEALGATDVEVTCVEEDGRYRITIDRSVPVTVPSFARKVLSPRTKIHQVDEWSLADLAEMTGRWTVKTHGLPIEMRGTVRLSPSGSGSVHEITGDMHVGIPLIGGRLKKYLLGDTIESISGEHAFGVTWLTGEV